jgi:gluconate 2-dehydrogenase
MRKILITGDFEIDLSIFQKNFEVIHIRCPADEQQILDILPQVHDYILGGPEYLSERLIDAATHLENVVLMGTGISSFVDEKHAKRRGIRLTNTPNMNIRAVVEFALAIITTCTAKVFESIECIKDGTRWIQSPRPSVPDLTVGFVGMGAIAREMASQLHLRGCRNMRYWSRNRKFDLETSLGLNYDSLVDIVKRVDILCIHIKCCDQTRSLIDEYLLKSASPSLKIFNMSSAHIICHTALKRFLQSNPDAFCFIDGYYNEWVDNKGENSDPYGLLALPVSSLMVTSHLAAQEKATVQKMFTRAASQIVQANCNS